MNIFQQFIPDLEFGIYICRCISAHTYRMIEEHKSLEVSDKDSGSNTLTFFSFLPQFPLYIQAKCFSLSHTCVLGKILSEIPAVNRAGRWGGFEGIISIHSLFAVRPSDSLKHVQHTHTHTPFLHLALTTGHTHTHHANLSILTPYTS